MTGEFTYRTTRGGHVPLNHRERRQFIELYVEHDRSVSEIAGLFGLSVGQAYRILPLLGCRAQDEVDELAVRRRAGGRRG